MARPKGSLNYARITESLTADLKRKGSVVVAAVVDEAMAGNASAQKLVIDRLIPTLKPESRIFKFKLDISQPLTAQASQIMKACSDGEIPADVATNLINSISSLVKVREIDQLSEQLNQLEERIDNGKQYARSA